MKFVLGCCFLAVCLARAGAASVPAPAEPAHRTEATRYDDAVSFTRRHLLEGKSDAKPFFGSVVVIQAGAWNWLGKAGDLGVRNAHRAFVMVPESAHRYRRRDTCTLADAQEIATLFRHLRETISAGGGGFIRQLTAEETERLLNHSLAKHPETIVAVETGDGHHVFAFTYEHPGFVDAVDDLAASW